MKQIPILFSTPMVQAELEGRKTMTRRVNGLGNINNNPHDWEWGKRHDGAAPFNMYADINGLWFVFWNNDTENPEHIKCPYGKPGDILWVRESFAYVVRDKSGPVWDSLIYKASSEGYEGKWKPPIHMPKAAARIWLEVVSVKVERVQDITEDDAKAEGIRFYKDEGRPRYKDYSPAAKGYDDLDFGYPSFGIAKTSFCTLWESINGEESWKANPWVWVVEFKVLSTDGKPEGVS